MTNVIFRGKVFDSLIVKGIKLSEKEIVLEMVYGIYYFHFLSYIQIVWVNMVELTRKGMQVLTYLVFQWLYLHPQQLR